MLSVVIIAWNEEKNLPRAVASVKKWVDEVVVIVDSSSIDQTKQVAKKLGCKVFEHEHTGIVEPMRNFAIAKAKNDWILLMDADEEIPPALATMIPDLLKEPIDYYKIPRKNIIFGKWIKSGHWWPDYVYRLFKKDALVWDDAVHSLPFTRGVGKDLPAQEDLAIIHHHYTSISEYVEKLGRYTDHQINNLQQKGYAFSWTDLLNKPFSEFISQYFSRKGYTQGIHGLALSGLQAFSELVLYLKMWEKQEFSEQEIDRKDVDAVLKRSAKEYRWWYFETQGDLWSKLKRKLGL